MSQEALKMSLEALEINLVFLRNVKPFKGQEDLASDCVAMTEETIASLRQAIAEAEKQERNFCSRCGKRLGKNDWDIHTCTPPEDA